MRILIAPDKFKGTLTAIEASEVMSRGARRAGAALRVAIEVDECPVADGGEGFLDAAVIGTSAHVRSARVRGPLGEPVDARWAMDGIRSAREHAAETMRLALRSLAPFSKPISREPFRTAFIESALCCGLGLVPQHRRDPERTTTLGLGDLILAASDEACEQIVIGLGGSATVDGGIGVATALGAMFLDARGDRVEPVGGALQRIERVVPPDNDALLLRTTFLAICDVDAPLIGPRGAARVYAPQKGATPSQVDRLEAGLMRLVDACRRAGLRVEPEVPGAGAAGGLGFALATFCHATLVPGGLYVTDLLGFASRARAADLVITGEGMLDEQTAQGKACAAVARVAALAGKPVIAVVGDTRGVVEELASDLARAGVRFEEIHRLTDLAPSPQYARDHAGAMLEEATYRAVDQWLRGSGRSK